MHIKYHLFTIFFTVNCYVHLRGSNVALKYFLTTSSLEEYLDKIAEYYYDSLIPKEYIMATIVTIK